MRKLIVIGGGEFARVIMDCASADPSWRIVGFLDPQPCADTTARLGIPRLGGDAAVADFPDAMFVLGIGGLGVSDVRRRVAHGLGIPDESWARIVHPTASVSPTATLGPGVVVLPGAVICTGARIGAHSVINLGAKIDHDVRVGEFVFVSPQAALGGGSTVDRDSYVGMGAIVRDHVRVSERTMIGMGAVVARTFPPGATLIGVPARERSAIVAT
jgi:acetyltransferase EpsM